MFTKFRERLLDAAVAAGFMSAVLAHREIKPLLSRDHFAVDGTLLDAWASLKSFRAKDGSDEPATPGRNGERQFKGETRRNDTHASSPDPEAKLYRKSISAAAKLSYIEHALAENRNGLIVEVNASQATCRAERAAALAMIERHDAGSERRLTLGADKGYDIAGFVAECGARVTPKVAAKVKHSGFDGRKTRHSAYAASQRKRKVIEEAFGWVKTIASMAKMNVRDLAHVRHCFILAMTAADNVIRMPKLLGWTAA